MIQKSLLGLFLVFIALIAQGQTTGLREEEVSKILPSLVKALEINDFDSIDSLNLEMERTFGAVSEITQRIHILYRVIQKKDVSDLIRSYLESRYDDVLLRRQNDAHHSDYLEIYNKNKQRYQFVPLRHAIDSLIEIKSNALLGSKSYNFNSVEETILVLFSDNQNAYLMITQKEKPLSEKEKLELVLRDKSRFPLTIYSGGYTPAYAVNPIFRTNLMFGVGFSSPLKNKLVVEGLLKWRTSNNDRYVDLRVTNTQVEELSVQHSLITGATLGYKYLDIGTFLMLAKIGSAYERVYLTSDRTKKPNVGVFVSDSQRRLNTHNLSVGTAAMKYLNKRIATGLQVNYHYSPYRDNRLVTPIASDYLSFELFFKF